MRKNSRPQYARYRQAITLIREGMRSGRLANTTTFMQAFGISRATAMRDLDALRDDEGAPIVYDASLKGYTLTDASWTLPPIRLSRQEVFAFAVAGKLLDAFRGTPLEVDMAALFDKIGQSMEGAVTLSPSALTDHLTVLGDDYVRQDPETWAAVAEAVDSRERVEIVYQKFDGTVKRYRLEPYHLLAYHGNWYVIGHNRDGGRIATFAVSRVRKIRRTGQGFDVDGAFDIHEHVRQAFGIVRGDRPFTVRLLFSPAVSAYIRERVWHSSQHMTDRRDGRVELRFETAGWNELVRWVLSWQPDVKVLSPKRLRDRVREKLELGLDRI